jgi:hypothetical protein
MKCFIYAFSLYQKREVKRLKYNTNSETNFLKKKVLQVKIAAEFSSLSFQLAFKSNRGRRESPSLTHLFSQGD